MTAPEFKSSEIGADPLFIAAREHYRTLEANGLTPADIEQVARWERFLARHSRVASPELEHIAEDAKAKLLELQVAEVVP